MAEEEEIELDEDIGEEVDEGKPSRRPVLSDKLAKLLVYVAVAIVGLLVSITVSIVVFNVYSGQKIESTPPLPDYTIIPAPYDYFDLIPQIRGVTRDQPSQSIVVKVNLGYTSGDTQLHSELTARTSQLTDVLRNYFSTKTAVELAPEREYAVKEEIKNLVNRMLSQGKVQDVIFPEFQVYAF